MAPLPGRLQQPMRTCPQAPNARLGSIGPWRPAELVPREPLGRQMLSPLASGSELARRSFACGACSDPAGVIADSEVDLPMARLFRRVPRAFFNAMRAECPSPCHCQRANSSQPVSPAQTHAQPSFGGWLLATDEARVWELTN